MQSVGLASKAKSKRRRDEVGWKGGVSEQEVLKNSTPSKCS